MIGTNPTYYEVLGVSQNATQKEIKRKYSKLMKDCHPDRIEGVLRRHEKSGDDELLSVLREKIKQAEEETKRLNEAYHVLSDRKRREAYNRTLPNIVISTTKLDLGLIKSVGKKASFTIENRGSTVNQVVVDWDGKPAWGELVIEPHPEDFFPIKVTVEVDPEGLSKGPRSQKVLITIDGRIYAVEVTFTIAFSTIKKRVKSVRNFLRHPRIDTAPVKLVFAWLIRKLSEVANIFKTRAGNTAKSTWLFIRQLKVTLPSIMPLLSWLLAKGKNNSEIVAILLVLILSTIITYSLIGHPAYNDKETSKSPAAVAQETEEQTLFDPAETVMLFTPEDTSTPLPFPATATDVPLPIGPFILLLDSQALVNGKPESGSIQLYDTVTRQVVWASELDIWYVPARLDYNFFRNLVVVGDGYSISIVDIYTGEVIRQWMTTDVVEDVSFSPDGEVIASVIGRSLMLWGTDSGDLICEGSDNRLTNVVFLSSQDLLTAGSGSLARWYAETCTLSNYLSPRYTVYKPDGLVSSRDGKTFVAISDSGLVEIWESLRQSRRELGPYLGKVAISPDGSTLAVYDGMITLIDIASGEEVVIEESGVYGNYKEFFSAITFSDDGKLIFTFVRVSGNDEHWELRSYDVKTGELISTFKDESFRGFNPQLIYIPER